MNGFIRALVIFLGCTFLVACDRSAKQKSDEAQRHINAARAYQQQGQWRAAMIEARNAASKADKPVQGLALLADIYIEIGANQAAAELLEKIAGNDVTLNLQLARTLIAERKYQSAQKILRGLPLQAVTDVAEFHQLMLLVNSLEGNFSSAQEHLTELERIKTPAEASFWRAQLTAAQGDWSGAQELLKHWVTQKPNDQEAWVLLGQIALNANQLEDAEGYLSKALGLVPAGDMLSAAKARVLNLLTEVLTRLGRSSEAYQYQKMIAEANPEGAAAQQKFNQALLLYEKGDFAQAQSVITELKKQFPQDKNTNTLLGLVQLQQGDTKAAQAIFDSTVDPETAAPRVLQAAALSKIRNQQIDEALELLKNAAINQPKSAEILATYGIALLDKNPADASAIEWLDKSLALQANQPKIYMAKARYFAGQNKLEESIAQLRLAVAQDPLHFETQQVLMQLLFANKQPDAITQFINALPESAAGRKHFWRGWLSLQQKNYTQAISAFEQAVPLSKDEKHLPLAGIAQVLQTQSNWADALPAWQQVISVAPGFIPAYEQFLAAAKNTQKLEQAELFLLSQSRLDENWQASWVLAQWFAANSELDKAIGHAEDVHRKAMQLPNIKQLLVQLYTQKAQELKAADILRSRDWINKALKLQPENPATLIYLVELELADAKIPQARAIIAEYAKGNSEPALLSFLNGLVLLAEGNKSEALAMLQASFAAKPTDKCAELIYSTLEKTDKPKATEFLPQWRKALPQSPRPLLIEALAAQGAGERSVAIAAYEQSLQLQAQSVLALNNLAWLYFEAKDPRALETAKRAVALAPNAAEVLDTYGWILAQTGHRAEGIRWLEKAQGLAPNIPEILKHLEAAKRL